MDTLYDSFKFLHIAAACLWVGGFVAMWVLNARTRGADPGVLGVTARSRRLIGAFVVGPASALTLVASIATMARSGVGFTPWIVWGLAAIVLLIALGATLLRCTYRELTRRIASAERSDAQIVSLQGRLAMFDLVAVLLLLSAVGAMVFKPTL